MAIISDTTDVSNACLYDCFLFFSLSVVVSLEEPVQAERRHFEGFLKTK